MRPINSPVSNTEAILGKMEKLKQEFEAFKMKGEFSIGTTDKTTPTKPKKQASKLRKTPNKQRQRNSNTHVAAPYTPSDFKQTKENSPDDANFDLFRGGPATKASFDFNAQPATSPTNIDVDDDMDVEESPPFTANPPVFPAQHEPLFPSESSAFGKVDPSALRGVGKTATGNSSTPGRQRRSRSSKTRSSAGARKTAGVPVVPGTLFGEAKDAAVPPVFGKPVFGGKGSLFDGATAPPKEPVFADHSKGPVSGTSDKTFFGPTADNNTNPVFGTTTDNNTNPVFGTTTTNPVFGATTDNIPVFGATTDNNPAFAEPPNKPQTTNSSGQNPMLSGDSPFSSAVPTTKDKHFVFGDSDAQQSTNSSPPKPPTPPTESRQFSFTFPSTSNSPTFPDQTPQSKADTANESGIPVFEVRLDDTPRRSRTRPGRKRDGRKSKSKPQQQASVPPSSGMFSYPPTQFAEMPPPEAVFPPNPPTAPKLFSVDVSSENPSAAIKQARDGGVAFSESRPQHDTTSPRNKTTPKRRPKKVDLEKVQARKHKEEGNSLYKEGKYELAIEAYTKAFECVNLNTFLWNRAAAQMMLNEYDAAYIDCRNAVQAPGPHNFKAELRMGDIALMHGHFSVARKHYKNCLKDATCMNKASEGAHLCNTASSKVREAELKLAKGVGASVLRLGEACLQISPRSGVVHLLCAAGMIARGPSKWSSPKALRRECGDYIAKAIAFAVAMPTTLDTRTEVMSIAAKYAKEINKADLMSEATEFLEMVLDEARRAGWSAAITKPVRALLSVFEQLTSAKNDANAKFRNKEYRQALHMYSSILRRRDATGSYKATIFCNRAAANMALGKYTDAVTDCSNALHIKPFFDKARIRRARAYAMLQKYREAMLDYERVYRHEPSPEVEAEMKAVKQKMYSKPKTNRHQRTSQGYRYSSSGKYNGGSTQTSHATPKNCHYTLLSIQSSASDDEIRRAYKKAALKYHPDKNINNPSAEEMFKRLVAAYDVLKDPAKRREYDRKTRMGGVGSYTSSSRWSSYYSQQRY